MLKVEIKNKKEVCKGCLFLKTCDENKEIECHKGIIENLLNTGFIKDEQTLILNFGKR